MNYEIFFIILISQFSRQVKIFPFPANRCFALYITEVESADAGRFISWTIRQGREGLGWRRRQKARHRAFFRWGSNLQVQISVEARSCRRRQWIRDAR